MSSTEELNEANRTYLVGDIHGCVEELEALVSHLENKEKIGVNDSLVFLGDYIDRGPSSKQVVDLLLDLKSRFPLIRFLKGNHEDMLLDFLGYGGTLGHAFLYNGGLETLESYGSSVFTSSHEVVDHLPIDHLDFYRNLELIVQLPKNYICVHAGLNPELSLEEQTPAEVCWIREKFLLSNHGFKNTVLFGHTPHKEIFCHLPFKIGLDTGLVFGNKLSCLELNEGKVFQVKHASRKVKTSKLDLSYSYASTPSS